VTPRGRPAPVRVPVGSADRFQVAYAELPPEKRVTVRWHVVRRGETLSGIASRYGVATRTLQNTNGIRRADRLQIGARLRVPSAGAVGGRMASGGEGGASTETVVHRVRAGESVWSIARRYGVQTADLLGWNGLTSRSVIHPGDRLQIRR
jgi:membrane-bound lytic murein transglycosylase D